jgi:quercetin dioxygenase-like cupin family protein
METTKVRTGVVPHGTGEVLIDGPLGATLLAGRADTGGSAAFVLHPMAPRTLGSPVHTHAHEDEWSYVLDGTVGMQVGESTWKAGRGDLVLKPRGIAHAFWNPTDEPATILEVITPGGFEGYFAELGRLFARSGPPDLDALAEIAERFGMSVDPDSVPRLAQAHDLRLG